MDLVQQHLNDLVEALKGTLGKFANKEGVTVEYHQTEPVIRFRFVTEDKLALNIKYEINRTSKEYIGNMILGIHNAIQDKRKERHDSPIILL